MEKFLFQCYLKYLNEMKKDKSSSFGYLGLFKLSLPYIVLLSIDFFLVSVLVIVSFMRSVYTYHFAFASFLLSLLLSRYTDYIKINKSVARLSAYKAHLSVLVDWMNEKCEVVLDNNLIELLIPRLERLSDDEKQKEEKMQKRTDDMFRLILIPVILLILTEIVKDQDLVIITSYSVVLLAVFFSIYSIVQNSLHIRFFFSRQRSEKLQLFISDLRSISDMGIHIVKYDNK